jgi:tetratricopeptide (TPR) repeat protein
VDRIFDLYDDISLQVATALGHVLEEEALIGAPIPRTDNLTAYNLLMEAWYTYRRTNDIAKVLELADRAIEADPGWARAHVVKAWALRLLTDSGQLPSDDGYAAARTQIETAIRLAPDYPHAQVMRATIVLRQEHDFRQAMNVYEEAERLGAPMLHWASDKALLYLAAGHPEEALAVLQRFERLDPMFAEPKVDIARALTYLGRQDEADEKIEAALSLAPRHSFVVNAASLHYLLSGNLAGLIGVQRRAGENAPPWLPAAIELLKGNDEPLRGWLETVNADNDKALYFPAFYTLGDYGKFMEGFEAAMHERSRWLAVPILLQDFPNHWQTLQSWALEDPNLTPDRLERIAAHRALVDRITRKMVL